MPTKLDIENNSDFIAKSLVIGVTVDMLMSEVNVYDWMTLKEKPIELVIKDFQKRTGFKNPKGKHQLLREKAFIYKFESAIKNLSALIEEVHGSYNLPSSKGINNDYINNYYYLKYWADKKSIAVNYNEKDFDKQKLFNLYTILFDIFADKLNNFNAYNRQNKKP